MKTNVGILSVTACLCLYFSVPKVQACVLNPTNYVQLSKPVPVSEANIVPQKPELQPLQQEDHHIFGPVIFFIIMLAVAAYIIYQLIKLLDKVIPPPDKKPDPPPNSGNTNYPPVVINPTHGPGMAPATLSTKHLTIDSNTPSWGAIQYYDIAALNYQDALEKFATRVNYDGFWSTGMTTTTDTIHWEDSHYRIDCYIAGSVGGVYYAYYHYGTNYWNCYYTSDYVASNHIAPAWFDLSDGPAKPNQFFRLAPR